jgi:IS1 family transposase
MIEKLYRRVELSFPDNKLEIFSDGNDDYEYVLPEYYAKTCINYAQLIKVKKGGNVIDKIKRVVFGNPHLDDIETTNIENLNSIMRERLGRLVRKTKCYIKKKIFLIQAIELLQFHWNTMKPIHGIASPAMKEFLTDHIWNWDDFLMYQCAP